MYSKSRKIRSRVNKKLGCGVVERTRNYEGSGQVGGALLNLTRMGAANPEHPYYHHYMALKGSGVVERTRNYEGSGVVERTRNYEGSGVVERTRKYEGSGFITDLLNSVNPLKLVGLGKKKKVHKKKGTSMRGQKVAELMRSKGLSLGEASKELKKMGM